MSLKRVTPLIALAVSAVIVFLLTRALRRYDLDEVIGALRDVSRGRLALVILFTAGSYFSLSLFDMLAVRYTRRKLPYRNVALASFTSLSIGHNVGLAALSSGAVRFRFYSRWGLPAEEVGKVIAFCAITVGLGLVTLAGIALTLHPRLAAALTGLGAAAAFAIGVGCLAVPVLWLVLTASVRRPLKLGRWRIKAPPPRLAAAQIAIGTMNFAFVAAALHQALLTVAEVGYFKVAAVYVIGNVAALISHVPGGLGVIEAVVIYLLPQAPFLSAVILFRAVYYLLPLPIGLTLFLVSELYYRRHPPCDDR